jgi:alpha-glucoside transport system substrate-binding protein
MSRQRIPQFVLVVMLIMSLITGCGAPAATPAAEVPTVLPTSASAKPTSPPPAAPAKVPSALEEALAGKYKGTTVNVGGPWGGHFVTVYENSLQDFGDKTGIDIQYQGIDQTDPAFIAAVEAGTGPDIIEFTLGLGMVWEFAKDGKVIDLTKVVDLEMLRARYDQDWLDWATLDGPNGPIVAGVWGPIWMGSVVWYPKAAFD